jgi:hypothetical protein
MWIYCKRDKRTRGAVRLVRDIRMRDRAYNFSAHFRVGQGARTDCLYRHATRRKLKLEIAYDPQCEILRMHVNPACVSKSGWH